MHDLLKDAADAGIDLFIDSGKLKARAASGVISEHFRARIRDSKESLLAYLLDREADVTGDAGAGAPIELITRDSEPVRASYAQERMWLTDQLATETHHYNIHGAFKVGSQFDVEIAERAFRKVIMRHESLRTNVFYNGTEVVQTINPDTSFRIKRRSLDQVRDLAHEEVASLIQDHAQSDFDFAHGEMLSVVFLSSSTSGYLSVCMPHLISDGWSEAILIGEFIEYYDAINEHRDPLLLPLEVQYADFSIWQRRWMDSPACAKQLAFWEQQLAGLPLSHSLPLDYERKANAARVGKTIVTDIPPSLTARIKSVASQLGMTSFMLFHAAIGLLISRHSNSSDVALGTPVSNRTNSQIEPLIGFFVNTLVMRITCDENLTAREYLESVRNVNIDAQANQLLPFSYLVEKIKPQRVRGIAPFFQILFTMDTNEQVALTLADEPLRYLEPDDTTAKYDLTISVSEQGDAFKLGINYDTGLFAASTIEPFTKRLTRILDSLTQNVDARLATVDMSDPSDTAYAHSTENDELVSSNFVALHQCFSRFAEQNPDQLALCDANASLNYRQVNQRANQLAHYLLANGIQRESTIGLSCERRVETFIGLLAILKAGAAYVPFQAEATDQRLQHIFNDTGLTQVICTTQTSTRLENLSSNCLILDDDQFKQQLGDYSRDNPQQSDELNQSLCYVIYTSGSTGAPKGVMIEHASVSHYVSALQQRFDIEPGLQYATLSTIATDLGNTTVFLALATGGTLHIASPEVALDSNAFNHYIQSRGVQAIKLTPSHFSALTSNNNQLDSLLAQCRWLFLGGERFPTALRQRLDSRRGDHHCRIINHYGPTETTIGFCVHELAETDGDITPIGSPLGLGNYCLLDRYGRRVPRGVPGELYLSGPGLARGYRNLPDLTAAAFSIHDSDKTRPIRRYRTGDWVKQNQFGELLFIGRIDKQIKIRGFRVELGEIEQAILDQTNVESVVVKLQQALPGDQQRLIAYYKLCSDVESSGHQSLSRSVSAMLPKHMLPETWVEIEHWPLTSNGKIDVRALPEPDPTMLVDIEPATTPREIELRSLWADLLGIDGSLIGKHSHFFDLGGHSLLAIRLVALISETHQIQISIRDIFDHPSLTTFALFTETADVAASLPPISRQTSDQQCFPLSYGQQLIWFIDQMEQGSAHYNMPAVLNIVGQFNITAANQSLALIIQRHAVLRTVYGDDNNSTTVQHILDQGNVGITYTDLSELTTDQQSTEIDKRVHHDASAAFDLSADMPLRLQFIQLSPLNGKLLFNMHHIASDGWSMKIFVEEFCQYYTGFSKGELVEPEPLEIQYSDFATWQKSESHEQQFEQQLDYWAKQLDGLPELHSLPLNSPRPEKRTFNGAGVSCILEQDIVDQLKRLANDSSSTFFMVLHAAFTMLISRYSNSDDIVIGTPVANRTQRVLETLIGFFVNTLVLRTRPQVEMSFSQLLDHVREVNLAAQANQEVPFERIVERLNPARSVQTSPLFQIMFTLDETPSTSLSLPEVTITPEYQQEAISKFELTVDATALNEGYFFNFQYNTDLFSRELIQRMSSDFMRLLHSVAQSPNLRLGQLNQLPHREVTSLSARAKQQAPINQCGDTLWYLDDCVEKHAQAMPASAAVQHDGQETSYLELNQRVNQLAHYLRQQGLQVGDLVCVLLPRSVDLIVGILAVMRCGGVYMATDTSYPAERVKSLVKQSCAPWCLTCSEFSGYVRDLSVAMVSIDEPATLDTIASQPIENVVVSRMSAAEQGAYLIYTSGSTGTPKGVLISQQALMAYLRSALMEYKVTPTDRVLQFSSTAFDIFIEEMSISFLAGACLCLRSESMVAGGDYFWDQLAAMDITVMSLPTGFWHQLVAELKPQVAEKLTELKTVILGGERLSNEAVVSWLSHIGDRVELFNTYGPTEATVVACVHKVTTNTDLGLSIPIGRPLANTQLAVLAPDQSLAPFGCAGELYIGGDSLAMGYWRDAVRTDESFVENLPQCTGRFYRSGDLVKYQRDGELCFIGRADSQVKVAGYRVELGEVEQQILKLDRVENAVVLAPINDRGERQLCAYVTLNVACDASIDTLQRQLRTELEASVPTYMLPNSIVVLESLPLTVNGKIDTGKLASTTLREQVREIIEPTSATELKLRKLWAELLNTQDADLSIHDNFFHLGGNSMKSIRLVLLLNERFGANLTVHNVFSMPSIHQLSKLIDTNGGDDGNLMTRLSSTVVDTGQRSTDDRTTMFCIPGVLGTAATFHSLSRALPDMELYAFNHAGVLDQQRSHNDLDQMADSFLSEMNSVQDQGPFIILGHSLGAKIAYEIAARLEQHGHDTVLIVLDSALTSKHDELAAPDQHSTRNDIPRIHESGLPESAQQLSDLLAASIDCETKRLDIQSRLSAIYNHHATLSETHSVSIKLRADVLAIYAADSVIQPLSRADITSGNLTLERSTGSHDTMLMDENVGVCANIIRRYLEPRANVYGDADRAAPNQTSSL